MRYTLAHSQTNHCGDLTIRQMQMQFRFSALEHTHTYAAGQKLMLIGWNTSKTLAAAATQK